MKILKVLGKILLTLVIIAALAVGGIALWHAIGLKPFYERAEQAFLIPGYEDPNFDQQGLCYDEDAHLFFFGGYMRDGTADPIYLVNPDSGEVVKKVLLLDPNGAPQTSHAGGLVVHGRYVYLAGSGAHCLYVYEREAVLNAENGASIPCVGVFQTGVSEQDHVKVSHVTQDESRLYVGEFHMPVIPSYQLLPGHEMSTSAGKTYALLVGFEYDDTMPLGLREAPCVCYALPDLVQGVAIHDGKIYLSKSIFYILSTISVNTAQQEGTYTVMGTEVPLYVLREEGTLKAIPMSEEIEFYNDRLYINSEVINFFAPGLGKLWKGQYCYSLLPDQIR